MSSRTEAHAELCKHNKAALAFAERDLGDAARRAARAADGSSKRKRLIGVIEQRKLEIQAIKAFHLANGPTCEFCRGNRA